ncbi:MAG: 1-acyl-sn-glycerol-3-phosphate acyltransferase [Marmoricola sp.]|nr:1-acyl-sn-glycerol-3-phosphate acyltransferase [Marmoricola sp.]
MILVPVMKVFFGLTATGTENIPKTGPVVIAPNHKNFWDAFFIAAVVRRRIHFMGKAELFQGFHGRLLVALGGFPVLRGEPDALAIGTARSSSPRAPAGADRLPVAGGLATAGIGYALYRRRQR